MTRPNSPDSLFESSSKGEAAIRNDWEKSKLKKRVEANEESIQKALDILDKLAQQIKGFNNLNTPKGIFILITDSETQRPEIYLPKILSPFLTLVN